jgi:DNA-binding CsgD family transcriptional regulator
VHRAGRLAGLDLRTVEVAADSLAGAGIVERGEPLRFVHPVIAAALAFDMGHFARGRAHRRAAELLEADGEDVEQVAAHLVRAPADGDPHVVEVLEAAARSAVKLGNPGAASRLLARALDEPPPPAARARIVLAAAKAEALAGSPLAASRLEEALATLEAGELRADALGELATLLRHSGQLKRSVELARLARAELPPEHPRQEQLLAIELTSATLVPELRAAVADTLAPVRAAALAGRPPSDLRLLALLIGWLGIADPPPLVRQLAERAITADPLIDDPHGMSVGWVAAALVWTDELALAERWLSSASTVSERRGAVAADGVARLNRANARYHMGRLDDAVADAEHALRAGRTSPLWSAPIVAGAQIARGNLPAARAALALGARQQSDAPEHALLVQARAQLALAAGEPAAALRAARAVGELVDERFGVAQPRLWDWRRIAALAAHRLGRRDEADALITPDLETLREIGPGRQLGAALTVAGVVRDDTELLAEATRVLAESPAKLQRLESLLELGAALRRTGRRDDAKEPLYAALELADEFGAAPAARRARDELGALGLRPRRAARTGLAALTASERRVAELAAEGMSTPQIAAQLHVSRNTVETHLGHVYRKLDVAGRAELRAVLADSAEAAGKA